jgi:hypothetical protein
MAGTNPIDPGHNQTRALLRLAGPLLMVVGGLLAIVGAVDFFSAFGSMRPPTLVWCLFVGLPLLSLGFAVARAGFAGKVARYYSQEYTPVATDTFKYAAREAKDGIRDVASAIAEGLALPNEVELTESSQAPGDPEAGSRSAPEVGRGRSAITRPGEAVRLIRCHRCNHDNAAQARFCSACGVALTKNVPCPNCRELNDPDAKFCDNCGKPMC